MYSLIDIIFTRTLTIVKKKTFNFLYIFIAGELAQVCHRVCRVFTCQSKRCHCCGVWRKHYDKRQHKQSKPALTGILLLRSSQLFSFFFFILLNTSSMLMCPREDQHLYSTCVPVKINSWVLLIDRFNFDSKIRPHTNNCFTFSPLNCNTS